MALKFDSIRAKALKARANWDELGKAYDALNQAIPDHTADVKAMAAEVGSMESDLQFAVNTLGNGGEPSSKASAEPVQPVSPQGEVHDPVGTQNAPVIRASPPAVGQSAPNFHEG